MIEFTYSEFRNSVPVVWDVQFIIDSSSKGISTDEFQNRIAGAIADIPNIKTPKSFNSNLPECLFHNHIRGRVLYIIFNDSFFENKMTKDIFHRILTDFDDSLLGSGCYVKRSGMQARETELLTHNDIKRTEYKDLYLPKYYMELEVDFDLERTYESIIPRRKGSLLSKDEFKQKIQMLSGERIK